MLTRRERIACTTDMSLLSGRKLVSSDFFDEKKPIAQGGKGQVLVG